MKNSNRPQSRIKCIEFFKVVGPPLILLLSLAGGALIGPVANVVSAKNFYVKLAWRSSSLVVFGILCIPFYLIYFIVNLKFYHRRPKSFLQGNRASAAISSRQETLKSSPDSNEEGEKYSVLTKLLVVLISVVFKTCWMFGAMWSMVNTVQAHAYTLSNLHGVFTILFAVITCRKTNKWELISCVIIIAATMLMMFDPDAQKDGQQVSLFADSIALAASIPGAILFNMSPLITKAEIPIPKLIVIQILSVCLIHVGFAFVVGGIRFDFTDEGLFGFLRPDNFFVCVFLYGFVTGFFGQSGYIIASFYNPPLIVMNTLLMEPFVSQIIGVMIGIEQWPGWLTWMSVVMITIAINLIFFGEKQKHKVSLESRENLKQTLSGSQPTISHLQHLSSIEVETPAAKKSKPA